MQFGAGMSRSTLHVRKLGIYHMIFKVGLHVRIGTLYRDWNSLPTESFLILTRRLIYLTIRSCFFGLGRVVQQEQKTKQKRCDLYLFFLMGIGSLFYLGSYKIGDRVADYQYLGKPTTLIDLEFLDLEFFSSSFLFFHFSIVECSCNFCQ